MREGNIAGGNEKFLWDEVKTYLSYLHAQNHIFVCAKMTLRVMSKILCKQAA